MFEIQNNPHLCYNDRQIAQWKNARELLHNYEGDVKEELRPYEVVILIRR